jgi:membrane peptidoglycan carboxypeptidase
MFAIVSVLSGVLVAGLFVPFAGLAGLSSKAAATELNNLPVEFSTPTPPTRSKVLLDNGKVLAYFYDENRVPVSLGRIAPVMRQAQLAIEDHRFYQHGALDLKGTMRALVRNSATDTGTQGGSTISQQYVKMVQVEACQARNDAKCAQAAIAPTMERKIRELRYAIALEKKLSKDQILERYLNIAYYGQGAYGVQAAAKYYFSTNAKDLTLPQAAMLAGLVQNPDTNNPVRNRSAALDRRDVVINRMAELKLITPRQVVATKRTGFDESLVKPTRNGCVGTRYPFLCDYVRRTLLQSESLGKTVEERSNMIKRGGITVRTAIDPRSQDRAQKAVSRVVDAKDPIISTMTMLQPGTGLIVAMAQSRPVMGLSKKKGETFYNYSVSQALGGAEGYQAGSTFKAFTAAAALQKGIPLSKKYKATSPMTFSGKTFTSCEGPFRLGGNYKPKNSTGTNGVMDMYKGAARSVNTYFLQLEQTTGLCEVTKMAERLGVELSDPEIDMVDHYDTVPSFTLGVAEVTPISMAEAYATFASRGIHCNPIIISKIEDRNGRKLAPPSADCKRVISKDVADGMNRLLGGVMKGSGTGTKDRVPGVPSQAGKTGTINNNNAVWFAGYTPELAGVSMIAIDKTRKPWVGPNKRRQGVAGYRLPNSGTYLEGSGSSDAGLKIWRPAMTQALKGLPRTSFKQPSSRILHGKKVRMPSIYGLGVRAATKKLEKAGFTVATKFEYSKKPEGTFLGWSQYGGRISEYATVYVLRSNGKEDPAVVKARKDKEKAEKKAAEEAKKKKEDAAKKKKEDAAEAARKAREEARKAAEKPPAGG